MSADCDPPRPTLRPGKIGNPRETGGKTRLGQIHSLLPLHLCTGLCYPLSLSLFLSAFLLTLPHLGQRSKSFFFIQVYRFFPPLFSSSISRNKMSRGRNEFLIFFKEVLSDVSIEEGDFLFLEEICLVELEKKFCSRRMIGGQASSPSLPKERSKLGQSAKGQKSRKFRAIGYRGQRSSPGNGEARRVRSRQFGANC